MHGVQPNANAMPTSSAPSGPVGSRVRLHPRVPVEPLDPENPRQVQAEDHEQHAGDFLEDVRWFRPERLAERAWRWRRTR